MPMKHLLGRYTNERMHWVGNGFPVRTLFDYNAVGQRLSPFLMLDRAGPPDLDDLLGFGHSFLLLLPLHGRPACVQASPSRDPGAGSATTSSERRIVVREPVAVKEGMN